MHVMHEAKLLIRQARNRLSAGERDQAADLYNQALRLDPRSAEAHYGLGLFHWRSNVSEAEYRAYIARGCDRSYGPAWVLLSNAYFAQRLRAEAWALQDRAAREAGDNRPLLAQIAFVDCVQTALVYEETGCYPMAEGYLRDALKYHFAYAFHEAEIDTDPLFPFVADAHHTLARVLQRQGKAEEARWHYRLAQRIDPVVALDPMYREIMSDIDPDTPPSTGGS
jgi:tetratricopeptide (TPR) repeat protein